MEAAASPGAARGRRTGGRRLVRPSPTAAEEDVPVLEGREPTTTASPPPRGATARGEIRDEGATSGAAHKAGGRFVVPPAPARDLERGRRSVWRSRPPRPPLDSMVEGDRRGAFNNEFGGRRWALLRVYEQTVEGGARLKQAIMSAGGWADQRIPDREGPLPAVAAGKLGGRMRIGMGAGPPSRWPQDQAAELDIDSGPRQPECSAAPGGDQNAPRGQPRRQPRPAIHDVGAGGCQASPNGDDAGLGAVRPGARYDGGVAWRPRRSGPTEPERCLAIARRPWRASVPCASVSGRGRRVGVHRTTASSY